MAAMWLLALSWFGLSLFGLWVGGRDTEQLTVETAALRHADSQSRTGSLLPAYLPHCAAEVAVLGVLPMWVAGGGAL